jgi:hypothetical protein
MLLSLVFAEAGSNGELEHFGQVALRQRRALYVLQCADFMRHHYASLRRYWQHVPHLDKKKKKLKS